MLATAHFHMLFPKPRSDVDDSEGTGPCGGFPVSNNRTQVPLSDFPVALEMGHDRTVIQMLLALGSNPGDNFNITLKQTFQQQGEGNFCLPNIAVPSDLGIADGTNGTLQVVTDGEGGGGLYIVRLISRRRTTMTDIFSVRTSPSLARRTRSLHLVRMALASQPAHFPISSMPTNQVQMALHRVAALHQVPVLLRLQRQLAARAAQRAGKP